jgi:hypothetical protein
MYQSKLQKCHSDSKLDNSNTISIDKLKKCPSVSQLNDQIIITFLDVKNRNSFYGSMELQAKATPNELANNIDDIKKLIEIAEVPIKYRRKRFMAVDADAETKLHQIAARINGELIGDSSIKEEPIKRRFVATRCFQTKITIRKKAPQLPKTPPRERNNRNHVLPDDIFSHLNGIMDIKKAGYRLIVPIEESIEQSLVELSIPRKPDPLPPMQSFSQGWSVIKDKFFYHESPIQSDHRCITRKSILKYSGTNTTPVAIFEPRAIRSNESSTKKLNLYKEKKILDSSIYRYDNRKSINMLSECMKDRTLQNINGRLHISPTINSYLNHFVKPKPAIAPVQKETAKSAPLKLDKCGKPRPNPIIASHSGVENRSRTFIKNCKLRAICEKYSQGFESSL